MIERRTCKKTSKYKYAKKFQVMTSSANDIREGRPRTEIWGGVSKIGMGAGKLLKRGDIREKT